MAMLTNAYETQIVQSLGVRIGPAVEAGTPSASSKCPFSAMIPGTEQSQPLDAVLGSLGRSEPEPIQWTAAAEARLANIPEFVRPMAKAGIEKFARENGSTEIDEKMLDAAREFFGM